MPCGEVRLRNLLLLLPGRSEQMASILHSACPRSPVLETKATIQHGEATGSALHQQLERLVAHGHGWHQHNRFCD